MQRFVLSAGLTASTALAETTTDITPLLNKLSNAMTSSVTD